MIRITINPSAAGSDPTLAVDIGYERGVYFYTARSGLRNSFRTLEALRYALRNEANEPRAEELTAELWRRMSTCTSGHDWPAREDTDTRWQPCSRCGALR